MQDLLFARGDVRPRDALQERRERQRYWLLVGIYDRTGAECDAPVSALEVGEAMGLSREDTFRLVQFLAQHGYLDYIGAGPRVCLTQEGIRYLTREADRRRSVRDPQ